MKNCLILLVLLLFISQGQSRADDFLGAPVAPEGKIMQKTDTRLELRTELSHNEVLDFYKDALKGSKDIKFREWKDATYIEDDGNCDWHSVTISKGGGDGTTVIIVKDNWTWIIGTLILRYIGVFVVLIVLFIGMSISGGIISRSVKKTD
ncbi:MAG: hypothetical protein SV775_02790 [Thermodesulfobacteriota bacterium]|nr:hypothetical protein [Thermodesulfobacteriota bacterium]